MLSRRQFLQAAGIAAAAAHLPRFSFNASAAPRFEPLYGRALHALPIYATPEMTGEPLKTLWSDTVTPILEARDGWYRLPDGYTRRVMMQPMVQPAEQAETPANPPFWGEVSGAVAVIREWCAADAPLVTRIGHGGMLHIGDRITLDGIDWYGVHESEQSALLGWTPAVNWSPVEVETTLPSLTLAVDARAQHLDVYEGAQQILSAPVFIGRDLLPGRYALNERQMTMRSGANYGAAWALMFGDELKLAGAYWHNRFSMARGGEPATGAALEVTPALARWLYPHAAEVIIS